MEIVFATKNKHKIEEVRLIAPKKIEILPLPENVPEAPEKGESFIENAVLKALWYMEHLKKPVIADDSGLEIYALKGFPGVHSSRFMEGEDYKVKMQKILKMLEDERNRGAAFVCQAVFVSPDGVMAATRGVVKGKIASEIRGEKGFGYDPIFIPEGYEKTFGELGENVKSKISHRYRAFKRLFEILDTVHSFL